MQIKVEELTKTVMNELNKFGTMTQQEVNDAVDKVRKIGARKLRENSPRGRTKLVKRNHYADNWTSTLDKTRSSTKGIVRNKKPTYRVAHLLEKGTPTASPRVHIKPIELEMIKKFEEEITRGK